MKTVAYISDFAESLEREKKWLENIKHDSGADRVIGIMGGDYLQNGLPAKKSRAERADNAHQSGVDLLIEMSLFISVSSLGIYAFSMARILDKMRTVDEVVLEMEDTDGEFLERITMFLIRNDKEFQKKVGTYKKGGLDFYPAQAKALEEFVSGSETVMNSTYNIFAVEIMTALKYMYSRIQIRFVEKRSHQEAHTTDGNEFSDYLKYQLYLIDAKQQLDLYGGNDILCKMIEGHREEMNDFQSFASLVARKGFDEVEVRKYFLHLLLQIKNTDISVWRMYDFAPYCKCSAPRMSDEEKKVLKDTSNIILLLDTEDEEKLNRSMKHALEKEAQCADIYKIAMEKM